MTAKTNQNLSPKDNLLMQGLAAILGSIAKTNPSLKPEIVEVVSTCKKALIDDDFGLIYKNLTELSKRAAIVKTNAEQTIDSDGIIKLLDTVGKFGNGVITKDQKNGLVSIKRQLKTGESSNSEAASAISDVMEDVVYSVDTLAKRNYSGEVKGNGYSEGVEKVLQADLAVATRRLGRDLNRLTSLLIKQFPDNPTFNELRTKVVGLKDGSSKFFEAIDILSELSWAIHSVNDKKIEADKDYLVKMASQFQNMAHSLKEQTGLAERGSASLNSFEREMNAYIDEIKNVGQNSGDMDKLKGKMMENIGKMQNSMTEFASEQNEIITQQKAHITRQARNINLVNTKLKEAKENLALTKKEVYSDELTMIQNRRGYNSHIEMIQDKWETNQTPTSILVLDIDHFKKINDKYGHNVGDQVLTYIGKILNRLMHYYPNCYCARYGGEEFVVVIEDTNKNQTMAIARKLNKTISSNMFKCKERINQFSLTASIGVGFFLEADDTHEEVFKAADKALYSAKENGRNAVWLSKGGAVDKKLGEASATPPKSEKESS